MSLQEKLNKISQDQQEVKKNEEKEIREKEFEPIHARIKELENQKYRLNLAKDSLGLKSGESTGRGIKEYSKDTKGKIEKESNQLDALVDEHKEVLQTKGIENRDQLVENSEFVEETEVVTYKKVKEQAEDLEISDSALQKRLEELGVDIDGENFSYDSAEKALAEKLQSVEDELLQEKLKTPEGKEEAVGELSKKLEKSIPKFYFSKDEKIGKEVLSLSSQYRHEGEIVISGEKTKFEKWWDAKLLPDEMSALEKIYGNEIPREAVKKTYENKIDTAFEEYDKKTENIDKVLKEDLEKVSPEKWKEAEKVVREFQNLASVFKTTLKEKSEELKKKGINFDPIYIQGYGGEYKEYAILGECDSEKQLIEEIINDPETYPPKINFDALKNYAEKRIGFIKELTEDVKKIETEDDAYKFTRGAHPPIQRAHKNLLSEDFKQIRFYGGEYQEQIKEEALKKFKSYSEASDYFEKKISEREALKQKLFQNLEIAVDAQLKKRELYQMNERNNMNIERIGDEISDLEKKKEEASSLIKEIANVEHSLLVAGLSQNDLIFNVAYITVPSIDKKIEELKKNQENNKEDLDVLNKRVIDQEKKEPKHFGKEKWQTKLDELKSQKNGLEQKISLANEDIKNLENKKLFKVSFSQYFTLKELVSEQINIRGKSHEIFNNLKSRLNKILNSEIPKDRIKLYRDWEGINKKYRALAEKL